MLKNVSKIIVLLSLTIIVSILLAEILGFIVNSIMIDGPFHFINYNLTKIEITISIIILFVGIYIFFTKNITKKSKLIIIPILLIGLIYLLYLITGNIIVLQ